MKLQIDLNDILGDEFGAETLAESVQRQVIEQTKKEIGSGIKKQIDAELAKFINELIKTEVQKLMPGFIAELMDAEYERRSRYGERDGVTTFRKEMIKTINEEMIYKPEKDRYHKDHENAFTRAIGSVVEAHTQKFQAEFNKVVDSEFTKTTVNFVTEELRKKFGIKP